MPREAAVTSPHDTGASDQALAAALAAWASAPAAATSAQVHAALLDARLLVPVVAALVPADEGAPASAGLAALDFAGLAGPTRGVPAEVTEMSLPTILGRDGRMGLPAFSSLQALTRWRAEARPVPVAGADVCRAALTEGCSALVVDVAGPVSFVVEGQALQDLAAGYVPVVAAGEATLAAHTVAGGLPVVAPARPPDPEALEGICAAVRGEPLIAEAFLLAPAEGPQHSGLTVALVLNDEMESSEVVVMVRRVAAALARTPFVEGGLDLAVLTPEQRRQARALGPPAYDSTAAVVGPGH